MAVDAEIFEVTLRFHLVEIKKAIGDTLLYEMLWEQVIRPALREIVWAYGKVISSNSRSDLVDKECFGERGSNMFLD